MTENRLRTDQPSAPIMNRPRPLSPVPLWALALILPFLASCEPIQNLLNGGAAPPSAPATNSVGVIDLEEVAKRLGRSEAVLKALGAKEQALGQQLLQLRGSLQEKVDKRKAEIGDKPTPDQQKELLTLAGTLNEEFGKARVSAQAALSQEQVALVQKFRDEVFPVAKEIAQERGFKTILLKSESVLFAWEPESEITEEVIQRMSTPLVP